jgi:hypothetical protein
MTKQRLYTGSETVPVREILFAEPQQVLLWFLQTLDKIQNKVKTDMIRDGYVPIGDERPPTIIVTFDVLGVPADPKKQEKANGHEVV